MKIPFKVDLTGKTAIVTGGSGTLCSAMAYGLAVSGAKTAIIGRNQEKLLKVVNKLTEDALNEYGKDVIVKGYSCNVTDKNELEKTYSLISSELGTCDILINGAGGNQPGAIASTEMLKKEKGEDDYSFWNLDEDKIRDVMDVNYMGTLLPIQVFTKDMVEKRSGSIINIASVTSILPLTKVVAYGNAKSAIFNPATGKAGWDRLHRVSALCAASAWHAFQGIRRKALLSPVSAHAERLPRHMPAPLALQTKSHPWDTPAGNRPDRHRNAPAPELPCRQRCLLHPHGKPLRRHRSHCICPGQCG